jgi:hypothetical protein
MAWAFSWLLITTGTWVDEQFVLVVALFLTAETVLNLRERKLNSPLFSLFTSSILSYLAAWKLLGSLLHDRFSFNQARPYLRPETFLSWDFALITKSCSWLAYQFLAMFGNVADLLEIAPLTVQLVALGLLLLGSYHVGRRLRRPPHRDETFLLIFIPFALTGMIYLLALKHRPILWPDVMRLGYYSIVPITVVYFWILLCLRSQRLLEWRQARAWIVIALSGFALLNVLTVGRTRYLMSIGHLAHTRRWCEEFNSRFTHDFRGDLRDVLDLDGAPPNERRFLNSFYH